MILLKISGFKNLEKSGRVATLVSVLLSQLFLTEKNYEFKYRCWKNNLYLMWLELEFKTELKIKSYRIGFGQPYSLEMLMKMDLIRLVQINKARSRNLYFKSNSVMFAETF